MEQGWRTMPKFEVGEICIFIKDYGPRCPWSYREELEILAIFPAYTPLPPPYNGLYEYFTETGYLATSRRGPQLVSEHCLAKRQQPDEPAQRFRDTLKPCDKQFTETLERWLRPAPAKEKEKSEISDRY